MQIFAKKSWGSVIISRDNRATANMHISLFGLMLKDDLFCLLKNLAFISSFLLCSLFSSKNPFNFFGMFYIFDVPRGKGFNDFRWNPTGGEGGEGRGGSRKHNFEEDVWNVWLLKIFCERVYQIFIVDTWPYAYRNVKQTKTDFT